MIKNPKQISEVRGKSPLLECIQRYIYFSNCYPMISDYAVVNDQSSSSLR